MLKTKVVLWILTLQHVLCIVQMAKSSAGRLHSMVGERVVGGTTRGNSAATRKHGHAMTPLASQ